MGGHAYPLLCPRVGERGRNRSALAIAFGQQWQGFRLCSELFDAFVEQLLEFLSESKGLCIVAAVGELVGQFPDSILEGHCDRPKSLWELAGQGNTACRVGSEGPEASGRVGTHSGKSKTA
jgi:hypothetical protein